LLIDFLESKECTWELENDKFQIIKCADRIFINKFEYNFKKEILNNVLNKNVRKYYVEWNLGKVRNNKFCDAEFHIDKNNKKKFLQRLNENYESRKIASDIIKDSDIILEFIPNNKFIQIKICFAKFEFDTYVKREDYIHKFEESISEEEIDEIILRSI
jgi:hypothetical protein